MKKKEKYEWNIIYSEGYINFLKKIPPIVFVKRLVWKILGINPYIGKTKLDILKTFISYVPHSYGKYKQMSLQTINEINQVFPLLQKLNNKITPILNDRILSIDNFLKESDADEEYIKMIEDKHSKFGSNKFQVHNYAKVYAKIFRNINNPSSILEIGLGTNNLKIMSSMAGHGSPGSSLKALSEIFPKAKIYGADIDKEILFSTEKIKTFYVDQLDSNTFLDIQKNINNKLDLIIDDGLHSISANINSIFFALDNLKKDGWLIIEDIGLNSSDIWLMISDIISKRYECYLIKTNGAYLFCIKNKISKFEKK